MAACRQSSSQSVVSYLRFRITGLRFPALFRRIISNLPWPMALAWSRVITLMPSGKTSPALTTTGALPPPISPTVSVIRLEYDSPLNKGSSQDEALKPSAAPSTTPSIALSSKAGAAAFLFIKSTMAFATGISFSGSSLSDTRMVSPMPS